LEFILDGYCGLYCGACPIMLDTKKGKPETTCHGCKSSQPAGHCLVCAIKSCAIERSFTFCSQCQDLQDCEKMSAFMNDTEWPYHQAVLKNFAAIQQAGLPQWLTEQAERWSCPTCGNPHSWWDESCPLCGAGVASYKADL
jgi:hypothetical protein